MSEEGCMVREPWELSFPAESQEVAGLLVLRSFSVQEGVILVK
ncbi:hypothetical protein ACIGW0_06010 [Streptomyces bikiniensis]|uniref:Uncharacterized protein n=1 Tax=Streptomyces bikiniensis TaxID=1896 RepID=A0ABW8CN42_STRBI